MARFYPGRMPSHRPPLAGTWPRAAAAMLDSGDAAAYTPLRTTGREPELTISLQKSSHREAAPVARSLPARRLATVASCCLCLAAAWPGPPATAQDRPSLARRLERIWKLDRDQDGRISRSEFQRWRGSQRRPGLFDEIDADGDGMLTGAEIEAWEARRAPPAPARPPPPPQGDTDFRLVYTQPGRKAQATAVLDLFGDGRPDLAIAAKRRVYILRNLGDMRFEEHAALKADRANGWGLHDLDRDRDLDLFVAQPQGRIHDAWLNQGDGTFRVEDLGNETRGSARTVLFADFDGDGFFDSYHGVSAFRTNHAGCELHPGQADGRFGPDIIEQVLDPPIPDFWYAMAEVPGRGREKWANKMMKGAVVRDLDGDGRPDLVTAAYADRGYQEGGRGGYGQQWVDRQARGLFIFHNRSRPGRIRFAEVAREAIGPSAWGASSRDWNAYAPVPLDYDRDGDLDLFVGAAIRPTENRGREDTLAVRFFENRSEPGRIRFVERTGEAGFGYLNDPPPVERARRRLAAGQACDYDNDGWVDLVLVNRVDIDKTPYPYVHLFRNLGDGRFEEVPAERHGLGSGSGGRDLVCADLDGDGDLDLVVNDGTAGGFSGWDNTRIYENRLQSDHHWIKFDLVDSTAGSPAIGARVAVYPAGSDRLIGYDEVRTDFSYRSKRPPTLHFGLGEVSRVDLRVTTRRGTKRVFAALAADRVHRLPLDED